METYEKGQEVVSFAKGEVQFGQVIGTPTAEMVLVKWSCGSTETVPAMSLLDAEEVMVGVA
jgi:hypothetical protein